MEVTGYSVSGNLYLRAGQDILGALKGDKTFFPLTEAFITDPSGMHVERPFVAVNKHHVVSLREEGTS